MQAEAPLVCSCGMWGLGVNDRMEQGVCFPWALLWNTILEYFFDCSLRFAASSGPSVLGTRFLRQGDWLVLFGVFNIPF